MLAPYFEKLVNGLEQKLAEDSGQYVARKRFALEIARHGHALFSGEHRVAWCGVLTPFDLLNTLGVKSCFVEFVGALLAASGMVERFLTDAEQRGFSTDACAYHRAVIGAMHGGLMPEPDFLVATTAPCTGGVAAVEHLARHFGKELFVLHVPNRKTPETVAFLVEQLRLLADFASAHTGQKLDPERLRQSMILSNQVRELLVEIYDLARAVPSPARIRDLVSFGIVLPLLSGDPVAVEVATAFRDEFRAKVEAGTAGVPGERIRLLWIQNRIQFRNPLEKLLEQEHRAAIVVDELNDVTWGPIDPDDPFPGLAERTMSISLVGPVERRIERLLRMARAYQVDGVINPCHWGCRQGAGPRGLISEALQKQGIPVLNLEVDCVDSRNFSEGQLRTRIDAFLELLASRPRARRTASGSEAAGN